MYTHPEIHLPLQISPITVEHGHIDFLGLGNFFRYIQISLALKELRYSRVFVISRIISEFPQIPRLRLRLP